MDGYVLTQIPVIDGNMVSTLPITAMKAGLNTEYDLMVGTTMHDGAPFALPFTDSPEEVYTFINFLMNAYQNQDQIVSLMLERDPGLLSEDLDTRQRALTKAGTDWVFGARALTEIELHSQ